MAGRLLGELKKVREDDWTDELMTEAAQLEERHNEIDEIADGLVVYKEDRDRAVRIVTIGDNKGFPFHQGLVDRRVLRGRGRAIGIHDR
jgi:hypothetical protein